MGKPNATLLIGCGEAAATKSIKLLLTDSCQVTEATSFDEVVREASAGDFDVVIVYGNCLSAPVLTSGGLLEKTTLAIRTIKAARPVPVIALTSTEEWRCDLVAAGADACITTPIDAGQLRHAVASCLQRRV
jgi:DNA-binding response OmpR family regulator